MRGGFGHLRREDKQREPHKVSPESQGVVPGPRDTARCVVSERGRVPRVHGADEPERGRYTQVRDGFITLHIQSRPLHAMTHM